MNHFLFFWLRLSKLNGIIKTIRLRKEKHIIFKSNELKVRQTKIRLTSKDALRFWFICLLLRFCCDKKQKRFWEQNEKDDDKKNHTRRLLPNIHRAFIRIDTTRSSNEWQRDQKIPFSNFISLCRHVMFFVFFLCCCCCYCCCICSLCLLSRFVRSLLYICVALCKCVFVGVHRFSIHFRWLALLVFPILFSSIFNVFLMFIPQRLRQKCLNISIGAQHARIYFVNWTRRMMSRRRHIHTHKKNMHEISECSKRIFPFRCVSVFHCCLCYCLTLNQSTKMPFITFSTCQRGMWWCQNGFVRRLVAIENFGSIRVRQVHIHTHILFHSFFLFFRSPIMYACATKCTCLIKFGARTQNVMNENLFET